MHYGYSKWRGGLQNEADFLLQTIWKMARHKKAFKAIWHKLERELHAWNVGMDDDIVNKHDLKCSPMRAWQKTIIFLTYLILNTSIISRGATPRPSGSRHCALTSCYLSPLLNVLLVKWSHDGYSMIVHMICSYEFYEIFTLSAFTGRKLIYCDQIANICWTKSFLSPWQHKLLNTIVILLPH